MERSGSVGMTSEDLFLAWFFGLPDGANVAEAARAELSRIDGETEASAELRSLGILLKQATLVPPVPPAGRNRRRH